jgi:hypothetical protein
VGVGRAPFPIPCDATETFADISFISSDVA